MQIFESAREREVLEKRIKINEMVYEEKKNGDLSF
jgi:hypothetical protein